MEFYKNRISKYQNFNINYWSEDYHSDDSLITDIQTHPVLHLPIKKKLRRRNISNISLFNSKFCISFEILTPADPNVFVM